MTEGFAEQLRTLGLPAPRSIRLSLDLQDATAALRDLPEPVAIACHNDDVAIAILAAARKLGHRVPEDVALIGVDATKIGALMSPRITTIGGDLAAVLDGVVRSTVDQVVGATTKVRPADDIVFAWCRAARPEAGRFASRQRRRGAFVALIGERNHPR